LFLLLLLLLPVLVLQLPHATHAADLIRPTQIGKCAALDRGYTNIYGRSAL